MNPFSIIDEFDLWFAIAANKHFGSNLDWGVRCRASMREFPIASDITCIYR